MLERRTCSLRFAGDLSLNISYIDIEIDMCQGIYPSVLWIVITSFRQHIKVFTECQLLRELDNGKAMPFLGMH